MPSSVTMPLSFAIYRPSSVPSRAISEKEISGIVPPSPRGKACALPNVVLRKFHLDFSYSQGSFRKGAVALLCGVTGDLFAPIYPNIPR